MTATKSIMAARHHGPGDLRLETVETASLRPGWVEVQPKAVGICGTDAHIHSGEFPARPPVTLGHEIAGVVTDVGDDVSDLDVGDRVCVEPHLFCTVCRYCRGGREHLCVDKLAFGVHLDGGMAESVALPRRTIYRVPEHISFSIAAMSEPLACSLHGFDRLAPRQGEPLAIIGAGPAGLINTALAAVAGTSPIVVIEPSARRRELATAFGADITVDPTADGWVQTTLDATDGHGFDAVIEAVGSGPTFERALQLTARGARVLAFGAAPTDATATVRPYDIFANELTVLGTVINPYTQERAVRMLDGLPFDRMPIETVPLSDVHRAFDGSLGDVVKVQIDPGA